MVLWTKHPVSKQQFHSSYICLQHYCSQVKEPILDLILTTQDNNILYLLTFLNALVMAFPWNHGWSAWHAIPLVPLLYTCPLLNTLRNTSWSWSNMAFKPLTITLTESMVNAASNWNGWEYRCLFIFILKIVLSLVFTPWQIRKKHHCIMVYNTLHPRQNDVFICCK